MTSLSFEVLGVSSDPFAATPTLLFRLRITEASGEPVHAMALRCQIRIEPQRRAHSGAEQAGLGELFGGPERWGETLKPFTWTHASTMVPGFTGAVEFDFPVACTYDFEVTASKYLHALRDGEVPLVLAFAGTVFTRGVAGFGVEQIPWHLEAGCRMPVAVWRQLMDAFFPNSGWIRLDRDTLDRLIRYKSERALPNWERVVDSLLPADAAVEAAVEVTA